MLNCNVLSFPPFYSGICNQLVKYHQSNTSIQDQKLSCHFLNELFCFESIAESIAFNSKFCYITDNALLNSL